MPKSGIFWGSLLSRYEKALEKLFTGVPLTPEALNNLASSEWFQQYSRRIASHMVSEAVKGNVKSWREAAFRKTRSRHIFESLQRELQGTQVGHTVAQAVQENADLISSLPTEIARQITSYAETQYRKGGRTPEIEALIRKKAPRLALSRVHLIARTELSKVESNLTEARSKDIGVNWYVWQTANDQRTRESHKKLNGVLVNWNDPPAPEFLIGLPTEGKYHAGKIYNCFVGDTIVTSPSIIEKVWKAPYRGDLVSLHLGRNVIRVTPNHPLLTSVGWKAAKDLQVGDNLTQVISDGFRGTEPYTDHRITTFDDLFTSIKLQTGEQIKPPTAFDFYGDSVSGDVHQVITNLGLSGYNEPRLFQSICNFLLSTTNSRVFISLYRVLLEIFGPCLSSCFNQILFTLFSSFGHSYEHGLGPIFAGNIGFFENSSDRYTANTKLVSDREFALPRYLQGDNFLFGKNRSIDGRSTSIPFTGVDPQSSNMPTKAVWADAELLSNGSNGDTRFYEGSRVLDKSVRDFFGHVYTLQSKLGWYGVTHGNIVARNCRCIALPLIELEEVKWPHQVYTGNKVIMMTINQFRNLENKSA
jgi:SPP1 gp7 family putative phage head morphogenesis protein